MNGTADSSVWFSHGGYRYDAGLKENQRVFEWTDKSEIWDWDNCTVSAIRLPGDRIRLVVRSSHTVRSEYRKSDVTLRYMLGVDVSRIQEPVREDYPQPPDHNVKDKVYGPPRPRWVLQLDETYWIWEWVREGVTITDSAVYAIYDVIKNLRSIPPSASNVFNVKTEESNDEIMIVAYQPAIDSWKNFLREVHLHRMTADELEVTLLFNNEHLREHAVLNPVYEWFRSLVYGRVIDVETFRVLLSGGQPRNFEFPGIYSGENDIQKDDVHEDKPDADGKVPSHMIRYYFANARIPIVFVNTANHAMAEHDTNNRLWKWEYVPWLKGSPIVVGRKSREEIDKSFRPKLKFW